MTHSPNVAIVMSRLRRLIAPNDAWVASLRGILRKIVHDGSTLIIGEGTAGADFIRHAAVRLGISFKIALPTPHGCDINQDVPPRDEAVLANADVVYVLGLRSGGNIYRLLRDRLLKQNGPVVLCDPAELQAAAARAELRELGARIWTLPVDSCKPLERRSAHAIDNHESTPATRDDVYQIVPFPPDEGWNFLTHTTRSCPGPWPDESFESYADSLFESRSDADHSALEALRRIACQRRLLASNTTIRGGQGMVSFSACPLGQLPALHRFRPHRVRWDFEPYGLCIRRDWLIERGMRPVLYGDDSLWESLAEVDQPFFQLAQGESQIDWSIEREWRHWGNLDLTDLTPDDVLLFVPHFEAAKSLARVRNWPITFYPDNDDLI